MRVLAKIVQALTRSHACHAITIHACARTDNIASTRVFKLSRLTEVMKDRHVYPFSSPDPTLLYLTG